MMPAGHYAGQGDIRNTRAVQALHAQSRMTFVIEGMTTSLSSNGIPIEPRVRNADY